MCLQLDCLSGRFIGQLTFNPRSTLHPYPTKFLRLRLRPENTVDSLGSVLWSKKRRNACAIDTVPWPHQKNHSLENMHCAKRTRLIPWVTRPAGPAQRGLSSLPYFFINFLFPSALSARILYIHNLVLTVSLNIAYRGSCSLPSLGSLYEIADPTIERDVGAGACRCGRVCRSCRFGLPRWK